MTRYGLRPSAVQGLRLHHFLIIVLLVPNTVAWSDSWNFKSPMPTARTFAGACVADDMLYVVGGCPATLATSVVELYDPSSDIWSSIPSLPQPRCYPVVCAFDGKVFVFGGAAGMWSTAQANVLVYDPQTNIWTQRADMPYAIGGSGSAVVGGLIYLFGGATGTSSPPVATTMSYSPTTEQWTQLPDMPTARNMVSSAVVDGKIYVIGGTTQNWENVFYQTVEMYDPVANTWTQKANMPTGRWGLATAVIGGRIHAIGGRAGTSSSAHEIFDAAGNIWFTSSPMQQVRTSPVAGLIGNKVYVTGGHQQGPPMVMLSSLEEYTPDQSSFNDHPDPARPSRFSVSQNYPNPFNPSTTFRYDLPVAAHVSLKIYNLIGQEVATVVNEPEEPGYKSVRWDTRHIASGTYFYRINTGSRSAVKKLVIVR